MTDWKPLNNPAIPGLEDPDLKPWQKLATTVQDGLVNDPNAHNHMGTGTDSTVLTGLLDSTQADASGDSSTAGGVGAIASGDNSLALGDGSQALAPYGVAEGHNAYVADIATSGVALGNQAQVTQAYGTALGVGARVLHDSSTAVGKNATTTAANQLMLGTATEKVYFPGTAPLQIPQGAGATKVLTSDASGNGTWGTAPGGGVTGFAAPNNTFSTTNADGVATTVMRTDSQLALFDATTPSTQAFGDAGTVGVAGKVARRDHKHVMPTAAVTTSGLTQATAKLLGRSTAATGAIEEIALGTNLSFSGTTLNASGGGASPLTTKGDVWGYSSADARIPIGSNNQVLTADSAQALGLKWATPATATTVATDVIFDAKGDLPVGTGADTAAKLTVGSNGQVLTADSTQSTGTKWATPGTGAVATDTIWDAKGDLAAGTGADTASKLAVGSDLLILMADSSQSTGLKWAGGAWTSYTPSWTGASSNPAIGNGTLAGAYQQIGKTVFARINMVMGSTTTFGSGAWRLSLPVNAKLSQGGSGMIWMYDSSAGFNYVALVRPGSPTAGTFQLMLFPGDTEVQSNKPITWAVNDILETNIVYEAA